MGVGGFLLSRMNYRPTSPRAQLTLPRWAWEGGRDFEHSLRSLKHKCHVQTARREEGERMYLRFFGPQMALD
jgi:hypothetical protein